MKTRCCSKAIFILTSLIATAFIYRFGSPAPNKYHLYAKVQSYLGTKFKSPRSHAPSDDDREEHLDQFSVGDLMHFAMRRREQTLALYNSRASQHSLLVQELFGDPLGAYQSRNFTHHHVTIQPSCKGSPFLLIQIHSSPDHFRSREAIRLSWGDPRNAMNRNRVVNRSQWKIIFVIGQSEIPEYNALVHHESCINKDILVTDFTDTYRNLSKKTVYAVRWAAKHCLPHYMLKTDEDCYVNPFNIVQFLTEYDRNPNKSILYTGRVQWAMTPYRDKTSRYYISQEDYPFPIIPPYVSGGGYLFSGEAIPKIANVSRYQRLIPNEDANFGLLMHAIDVDPVESNYIIPYIYCKAPLWKRSICDFVDPFVMHGITPRQQIELHYTILTLQASPFICKHTRKLRRTDDPPLYCSTM